MYYELANHLQIADIGFGTWKISEQKEADLAIKTALECGYTLIDTASKYKNEDIIGAALQHAGAERKNIFVEGKVWNKDRGYEKTLAAFEKTLKTLKMDYLDAYMVHWPAGPLFYDDWEKINADTWRALEKLYEEKMVRTIGVCNFETEHLRALEKTSNIKPMLNQVEFHPGCFPEKLYKYCRDSNIQMQAWSPLGSGILLKHEKIKTLAEKYKRSPAQICLRWCTQQQVIPLPKSVKPERIRENMELEGFLLKKEEIEQLRELI
jgi:diketogulonate reductase-like aldo/keto reductase